MKQDQGRQGFFSRVYRVVAGIPAGRVATYGQIAMLIGEPRKARVVGYAMRCAPENLPSHRVVNKSGQMAPEHVFGGAISQRQRLEQEGVRFREDGRVDMQASLWRLG